MHRQIPPPVFPDMQNSPPELSQGCALQPAQDLTRLISLRRTHQQIQLYGRFPLNLYLALCPASLKLP